MLILDSYTRIVSDFDDLETQNRRHIIRYTNIKRKNLYSRFDLGLYESVFLSIFISSELGLPRFRYPQFLVAYISRIIIFFITMS